MNAAKCSRTQDKKSILKHGNWNIENASVGKSLWKKINSETDKEPKRDLIDIYVLIDVALKTCSRHENTKKNLTRCGTIAGLNGLSLP